jgi:hypothetical protein
MNLASALSADRLTSSAITPILFAISHTAWDLFLHITIMSLLKQHLQGSITSMSIDQVHLALNIMLGFLWLTCLF